MSYKLPTHYKYDENTTHPADESRSGFDLLQFICERQDELNDAIEFSKKSFWQVWTTGKSDDGVCCVVFFKPSCIKEAWFDSPERPHPGNQTTLSVEDKLRNLTDIIDIRIHSSIAPSMLADFGGTTHFMTDDEKEKVHELKLIITPMRIQVMEAKARIAARIAERLVARKARSNRM